jgi:nucleoside-diphosphate kinase
MIEQTLSMIKPDAVKDRHVGDILQRFEKAGLAIGGLKMMHLTRETAEAFYAEHRGKDFFERLICFMTAGPMCALIIEGEDAVNRNREIMGATDPTKAAPGTLRALYADNVTINAVHGSDSAKSAAREIAFFFPERDRR